MSHYDMTNVNVMWQCVIFQMWRVNFFQCDNVTLWHDKCERDNVWYFKCEGEIFSYVTKVKCFMYMWQGLNGKVDSTQGIGLSQVSHFKMKNVSKIFEKGLKMVSDSGVRKTLKLGVLREDINTKKNFSIRALPELPKPPLPTPQFRQLYRLFPADKNDVLRVWRKKYWWW